MLAILLCAMEIGADHLLADVGAASGSSRSQSGLAIDGLDNILNELVKESLSDLVPALANLYRDYGHECLSTDFANSIL